MNEGPTAEDIELFLSTPEGKKALEELQRMQTDGGGYQPMTVAPKIVPDIPDSIDEVGYDPKVFSDTFDTIDEVGYDPDVDQIDIGASPDIRGATRGRPQGFSPYQDPPYQDPQNTDQSMTLEEKKRRRMLAQLMANQQTRIS
jgi:hypothetical protein